MCKKVNKLIRVTIIIDEFRRYFQAIDAKRLGMKSLEQMLSHKKLDEWVKTYALYRVDLE